MCLNTGLNSAQILGVIKKLDPTFKKNFEAKESSKNKSQSSSGKTVEPPKQKRRIRHTRQMRSNAGRRSFLEGGS